MRKIYLFIFTIIIASNFEAFAQNQDAFNYQAVIRNDEGELLENHDLNIFFEIIEEDTNSNVIYSEVHTAKTNKFGLIALEIGNGSPMAGEMGNINWASSSKFIRVSIDIDQTGEYKGMSTSQLLAVPYALHAKNSSDSFWKKNNEAINFSDGNVGIGNTTPQRLLDISLPTAGDEKDNGISLNRNGGFLNMINGTLYDGEFQARISAKSTHDDSPGIIIAATPSSDLENSKAILLRGGEFDPLVNSNILKIQNNLEDLMTVKSNGFVGIGNSQPKNLLDISGDKTGDERTMFSINNTNTSTTSSAALELKSGSDINYTTLRMHGDNYNYSWWGKHGQLKTLGDGLIIEATKDDGTGGEIVFVNGQTGTTNVEKTVTMTINQTGDVGIGIQAPNYKLDVDGTINATEYLINGETLNLSESVWESDASSAYYNVGSIGIGNTAPQKLLDISLPATGNEKDNGISLNRDGGYLNMINGTLYDGKFQARISAKSTHDDSPGMIVTATPNSDIIGSNSIILRGGEFDPLVNSNILKVQNNLEDLMTVKSNGNVGIGTTIPTAKLHVTQGDIYIEDAASGVIMTSPDGNCWRMTVDNNGNPAFKATDCPQ